MLILLADAMHVLYTNQLLGFIMNKIILTSILSLMTVSANAQLSVFTEHQVISMVRHGVNSNIDVPFPTGDYPYIGQIGLEYDFDYISYSLSYIHRSNVDITHGSEYNYDGIALGIKLKHCIYRCK